MTVLRSPIPALAALLPFLSLPIFATPAELVPSSEPILRIETGMHTAAIRRIDTDDAGRFLVTGSDDKTARVWDLESGELLRVLRPPISELNEGGGIDAVAISPDGKLVAAERRLSVRKQGETQHTDGPRAFHAMAFGHQSA